MEQYANVKVTEPAERKIGYTVSEEVTSNGKQYVVLDSEDYSIALFPANVEDDSDKKSLLKFNAFVTLKRSEIRFQTMIREFKDEQGNLVAGQQGKLRNHRAVVTEWNKDTKMSYERMSIPENMYREIIGIVKDYSTEPENQENNIQDGEV